MMTKDERLEKLRKQITSVAEKNKRLEEALHSRKKVPERGDIYLFDLKAIPEDVAVYWVILHRHPKDSNLFYTVPADTNPLEGIFDVSIPHTSLFGSLALRLGQGLWLPDNMFHPSQRVGMVEALFIDRAQFIMSRIAKNEWIGSKMQQATESNPDYEEWMEMFDQVCGAMITYREKQLVWVNADKKVAEGVKPYIEKAREWLLDISDEVLRKLNDILIPPIPELLVLRGGTVNQCVSENEKLYLEGLKKDAPLLPVAFRLLRGKVLEIDFIWIEKRPAIAPVVSATLKGVAIPPEDVSWESWDSKIQVLKIRNCTVLKREKEQAKSLIRVRTDYQTLYIDILPE